LKLHLTKRKGPENFQVLNRISPAASELISAVQNAALIGRVRIHSQRLSWISGESWTVMRSRPTFESLVPNHLIEAFSAAHGCSSDSKRLCCPALVLATTRCIMPPCQPRPSVPAPVTGFCASHLSSAQKVVACSESDEAPSNLSLWLHRTAQLSSKLRQFWLCLQHRLSAIFFLSTYLLVRTVVSAFIQCH